ncbi:hypothetical protein AMK26_18585 [Streptomyces sp. CB03234]|uniref:DUF4247 domain-containing protein n=1 Tax=Streptomyces sp. (strain CB03234) TaxID=1703937 RepID=UPI000938A885|nr:DUF4247 domain-containing protein [Streptomyces sp. CB03234]OKK03497.1 hypothetical protein AMK26_18585 [Streptomyces sp. CB03234]
MKTARRISALILATAALAACADEPDDDGNAVPSGWIRGEYSRSGAGYVDRTDPTSQVAKEIDGNTSAVDRLSDGDRRFLRYRDDIVAISPHSSGRGSVIEIADYRSGYHRWRTHIGSVWPDPDSAAFRGGGPGSGK